MGRWQHVALFPPEPEHGPRVLEMDQLRRVQQSGTTDCIPAYYPESEVHWRRAFPIDLYKLVRSRQLDKAHLFSLRVTRFSFGSRKSLLKFELPL